MNERTLHRLRRRYEQTKNMSEPEKRKYCAFIRNLYYLLTRAYWHNFMLNSPTLEDYNKYNEYCDTIADMLGVD